MPALDVLVIGGGPAGMAAAGAAASFGLKVILVEQAPFLGGALAVHTRSFGALLDRIVGRRGTDLVRDLAREIDVGDAGVMVQTTVWGIFPDGSVAVSRGGQGQLLRPRAIILATGSVDKSIPRPGWTLPGAFTGCGAHAMLNLHGVIPGRRAVVVGDGLLASDVAHNLAHQGLDVRGLVGGGGPEGDIVATSVLKAMAIHGLTTQLRVRYGVPVMRNLRLERILGKSSVEGVVLVDPVTKRTQEISVDLVCLAEGLQPEVELARHAECGVGYDRALGGYVVVRDHSLRTTRRNIYVAGDSAGIGGAWPAIRDGRLAAVTAAEDLGGLTKGAASAHRRRWGAKVPASWQPFFGEQRDARQRRLAATGFQKPQLGGSSDARR